MKNDPVALRPTQLLARQLIKQLRDSGANHYLEHTFGCTFEADDTQVDVVVILQKPDAPTPHQLRMAAEEALAAKDAEIAEWKLRCQYNADTAYAVGVERDNLRAQLAAQPEAVPVGWILAADQVPRSGKAVLAFYLNSHGKGRRIRAEYIARWTVPAEGFDPDPDTECVEYSEQDDVFYILEGWYELVDNWDDYSRIAVNEGVVTHWMDMPTAPAAPQHICLSNKANYETQTDLNAANEIQTAPAAPQQGVVIQDDRASLVNALEQVRTMVGNDEYADDVIGFINRTIYNHARLNADRSVQTDAARDVLAERRRQVEAEGWTPEHDDEHNGGQLARGAAAYAAQAGGVDGDVLFPWSENWWKPCEPRRMLVKAGALILAEIERLDRSAQEPKDSGDDRP